MTATKGKYPPLLSFGYVKEVSNPPSGSPPHRVSSSKYARAGADFPFIACPSVIRMNCVPPTGPRDPFFLNTVAAFLELFWFGEVNTKKGSGLLGTSLFSTLPSLFFLR